MTDRRFYSHKASLEIEFERFKSKPDKFALHQHERYQDYKFLLSLLNKNYKKDKRCSRYLYI